MIIRFTVDSLQQFQSGSLVIEIGDLDFELSFSESLGDAEKESNSVPLSATILTLQSALVEGHSCFTNVSAEGPLSSELLLELHTTFQDLMSQQDLRKLLINSIIDDPDGWILDLVEHPEERVDEQELRVFSFSLDPDRYISVHQLSKGDLIPPELNQFEDLMDDYIADIKEMDWKIWVQVDNGYIYREAMQDSLKGVIDGFDVPELGVWMEIRATGSSDVYHSDHNQLTDADFVLPCVPTGSDATIPVPSTPTPAGAAPDRSHIPLHPPATTNASSTPAAA